MHRLALEGKNEVSPDMQSMNQKLDKLIEDINLIKQALNLPTAKARISPQMIEVIEEEVSSFKSSTRSNLSAEIVPMKKQTKQRATEVKMSTSERPNDAMGHTSQIPSG